MKHGFVKIASAIPNVKVADCTHNVGEIIKLVEQAKEKGVEIICFPELAITSYTCHDLFAQQILLDEAEVALMQLVNFTRSLDIIIIVGLPVVHKTMLLNCAAVLQRGTILGILPKSHLPNYKEFYERRWFTSGATLDCEMIRIVGQQVPLTSDFIFHTPSCTFGIEICEDLWSAIPPSSALCLQGAEIIFNLSASNEVVGKYNYLCGLLSQQSARCLSGYVYSSCGYGESTQDVVYGGNAMIYENGELIAKSSRFSYKEQLVIAELDVEKLRAERRQNTSFANSLLLLEPSKKIVHINTEFLASEESEFMRTFNPHPFVPCGHELDERCEEIFSIQTAGLAKRIHHTNATTAVVGVSGGLDSTLALLVCVQVFDKLELARENIIGVTMPGFGTTNRTYTNALNLMRSLGVTVREIDIKASCLQHFADIAHDMSLHNVVYENGQARERTQILMDVANQMNGLVVGTGDLSELALGWATYNGDHMSMYSVNSSIPKTLVKHLVHWVAMNSVDELSRTTLLDIIETPISPELIPADVDGAIVQKTEEIVGPYELHDFFLYHFLRFGTRPAKLFFMASLAFKDLYDPVVIKRWLTVFFRRFFAQQFKRSCMPDGPKVGSCSLSPRGDWRMPCDASSSAWIEECEALEI